MNTNTVEPRLLTPEEVGRVVRRFRELHKWTQETLAELAGVTPRTLQRLEAGQPASLDTRRAVTRAFGVEDLDWLSKPMLMPTAEELEKQRQAFDREHLVLDARVVDGRGLMSVLIDEDCGALAGTGLSQLQPMVRESWAEALDLLRDCLDIRDVAGHAEMLGYGDSLDEILAPLREAGLCLTVATRRALLGRPDWTDQTPIPFSIMYVAATSADTPALKMAVPRKVSMSF